jgi:hypothetical protein
LILSALRETKRGKGRPEGPAALATADVEPVISSAAWAAAPRPTDGPAIKDQAMAAATAIQADPRITEPILRRVAAVLTISDPLGR